MSFKWFRPGQPATALVGEITMYFGDISAFPTATHALCDGGNGTPDLRGQFVRGWPDGMGQEFTGSVARRNDAQVAATNRGGLTVNNKAPFTSGDGVPNGPFDSWEIASTGDTSLSGTGAFIPKFLAGVNFGDGNHNHTLSTGDVETRPKNYALAFIMRIA